MTRRTAAAVRAAHPMRLNRNSFSTTTLAAHVPSGPYERPASCSEIVVGDPLQRAHGKPLYFAGCGACGLRVSDEDRDVVQRAVDEHNARVR